jgi:hypothetical protein
MEKSSNVVSEEKYDFEFETSKGNVKISFTDDEDNSEFKIEGPKELISSVIGGIGDDDGKVAWATEKNLDTESKRLYAVLKVLEKIYKNKK